MDDQTRGAAQRSMAWAQGKIARVFAAAEDPRQRIVDRALDMSERACNEIAALRRENAALAQEVRVARESKSGRFCSRRLPLCRRHACRAQQARAEGRGEGMSDETIYATNSADHYIERLKRLRAIDAETIERLTREAISDAQAIRAAQAREEIFRRRCEMIGAIMESVPEDNRALEDDAILTVLDRQVLPDQPCEDCRGPLLNGDGERCEWCDAKIPAPVDDAKANPVQMSAAERRGG